MISLRPVRRALLSVSDKTGLVPLAQALQQAGVELISTGGTRAALEAAGVRVRDIADVTGFPEMMDGRIKTLHPKVHGGLLARRDDATHQAALAAHGIPAIDLVVCNLYPFRETRARGAPDAEIIENIDIGGPAMLRSAAKNHESVCVLVDPQEYPAVITAVSETGGTTLAFRRLQAAKAFAHTAAYDQAIADWFAGSTRIPLRYGENPHQRAWLVRKAHPARLGVAQARQVQGKELSYNNLNDADAALECVREFDPNGPAAVVIVKHANPCGVAVAPTLEAAYRAALACDPTSAFGGIIAANRPLDGACARAMAEIFTEVILAPGADEAALQVLAAKKNLRLLLTEDPAFAQQAAAQAAQGHGAGAAPSPEEVYKTIAGGVLVQTRDDHALAGLALNVVTKRAPTAQEQADLLFAWLVAKHVKSNAIVYARDGATVGIGAGQMSRVDSARIAAWKAGEAARAAGRAVPLTQGAVVASDAFFPFADGLEALVAAGATAVIQPGGSVRDAEVIAAADRAGLAMVFTGIRHFRH